MIDEPLVGTLLGFALFGGLVYLVYTALRFDYKAFRAWVSWRLDRPKPGQYKYDYAFEKALFLWRYSDMPATHVFKRRR